MDEYEIGHWLEYWSLHRMAIKKIIHSWVHKIMEMISAHELVLSKAMTIDHSAYSNNMFRPVNSQQPYILTKSAINNVSMIRCLIIVTYARIFILKHFSSVLCIRTSPVNMWCVYLLYRESRIWPEPMQTSSLIINCKAYNLNRCVLQHIFIKLRFDNNLLGDIN